MDFYKAMVKQNISKNRQQDYLVYPSFNYIHTKDLVVKGGKLFAFWNGESWDESINNLIMKVDDGLLDKFHKEQKNNPDLVGTPLLISQHSSKQMEELKNYLKNVTTRQPIFNSKIIFSNQQAKRDDYSTTKLPYTPEKGSIKNFNELLEVLYLPEDIEKIVWFMGALLSGQMKNIQKFLYLYGGKGSGKGTVIKIFEMLFENYYDYIELSRLTSNGEFATSQVKETQLLIDTDADISQIKNDTYLLKLISHESIPVNKKYTEIYESVFQGLLITASNQRYKVRNVDSGITRRAVVAKPTHMTHEPQEYERLMAGIPYELPAIAAHAMEVFKELGPHYYEKYVDVDMAEATDYIYSFVRSNYTKMGNTVTLKKVALLFKEYLDDLGYDTKGYKRKIKNEMERYYREFHPQYMIDGEWQKNVFVGIKYDLINPVGHGSKIDDVKIPEFLDMTAPVSIFDQEGALYPAQLTTKDGFPKEKWDKVETTLGDIDTRELHFVKLPANHIVIDFDLKNELGLKDIQLNLKAAASWPETYAEVSKSGNGLHLHYIYDGDPAELSGLFEKDIEIKRFKGNASLRRKLILCNDFPIAHISTGLPLKERDELYNDIKDIQLNEKKMRTMVERNLRKEYHDATKPSVDFIVQIFSDAEKDGVQYDLSDLRQDVLVFASRSTNQAQAALKAVSGITWCTIDAEEIAAPKVNDSGVKLFADEDLMIYDMEVFPNVTIICASNISGTKRYKYFNPTPNEVERLIDQPLVGYNNRGYDNHILYGTLSGQTPYDNYVQSSRIINGRGSDGKFSGAYELSYLDVYDMSNTKQSLKKWEVELGLKHDELEFPWDEPLPEDQWERAAEYCMNDVEATIAVFQHLHEDYIARQILASLSGLSVNSTTQQHTARILFGTDPRPQDQFVYTDLSEEFPGYTFEYKEKEIEQPDGTVKVQKNYLSEYKGEIVGEGGYVWAKPGVYKTVVLLDAESMHPTSAIEMNYFGPYTQNYADLKAARVCIKEGRIEDAKLLYGGKLRPFLEDPSIDNGKLSYALKIAINIVYGMTSAKFDNKFRHPDNKDNIVAKRGALFMVELKSKLDERGVEYVHFKTDSVKLVDPTEEDVQFVKDFGMQYGYKFVHEATYEVMALVNKAVYIAKYGWAEKESKIGKWEPTGAQFQEPYVLKTLFTKEPITEKDFALTKSATAPIYVGEEFQGKVAVVYASHTGFDITRRAADKVGAITGTKGYKWRSFDDYQGRDDIDMGYYDSLIKDAIDNIDKVGPVGMVIEEVPSRYEELLLPF